MQNTATPTATDTHSIASPNLHASTHVDSHSIHDAVMFGMKITIACFLPFGLLIGNNRVPGSYYTYGYSTCFIWPMVSCIALGAVIGASLGYVFAVVGHASDPVPVTPEGVPVAKKAEKRHGIHLTLHSHHR